MSGAPTYFNLEYSQQIITPHLIVVSIINENGIEFKEHTVNNNGSYSTVQYTPPCNGIFEISVEYKGVKVPSCPVFVTVIPDMQKIHITDLPSHFMPGIMGSFFIRDINHAGQGKLRIKVHPENRPAIPIQVNDTEAGVVQVFFTPSFSSNHKITVSLSGTKKEPVTVPCYPCIENIKLTDVPETFTVDEKVKFNVDCTKAGIGELFVNILDPTMKSAEEAELILLAEELFEVSYVPRQPGLFSIFVSYDSVPLPNMPLHHMITGVPSRPASITQEPSVLQPVRPGQAHSIKIELKDIPCLPTEPLVISLKRADGLKVGFNLNNEDECSYILTFTLPTEGQYLISAHFGTEQLPGFPYSISAIPDLTKITIEKTGSEHQVNKLVSLAVCTREAGIDQLEAHVYDPENHETLDTVMEKSTEGRYNITFTPTKAGCYQLVLKHGGNDLPGMPMSVEVSDKTSPIINVTGSGVSPNQFCANEATFWITPKISAEDFSVDITGPENQVVSFELSETDDGLCCTYSTMSPGQYLINALYHGDHVSGSPFLSNVLPNVGNCRMIPGNTSTVSVGETLSFQIDCSTICAGTLSATVFPPSGKAFVPNIKEVSPLVFDISFLVQQEGQYGTELKHAEIFLPMSPYIFRPSKDKRELQVTGLSKNHRVRPGDIVEFEIDTSQFGSGYPEVYFADSQSKPVVNYSMVQLDERKFKVSFKPAKVETYSIVIKKEGRFAAGSPYGLVSAVNTSKMKITGKGINEGEVTAGKETNFEVNLGDAGEGDLTVEVLDPDSQTIPVSVSRVDEIARVSYCPSHPGMHTIYIKFHDTFIPNCPFQVSVLPTLPSTDSIVVNKRSAETIATGQLINFSVDTSKHEAGTLDVLAEVTGREVELQPNIEQSKGVHEVTIPTPISGEYVIFIKYNRKDVFGSPFHVLAKSNAAKITASGEGLQESKVPAKVQSTFHIHLNGERPSNMVVNVIDPYGYYVDEVVSEASFDVVKVNYLPMKTGQYVIEILCDDDHISGSPFNVFIEEINPSPQLKISGNITEKNAFQFQEAAFIVIDQSKCGQTEVEVTIKETNSGKLFQPTISNEQSGMLRISFPTYHAGNFEVSILSDGKHIPYSPFNYMVVSKGSEKVILDETKDYNVLVHETVRIPVITKHAGIGKLTSKCHHTRLKTSCKLQAVPKSEGNYDIIFQAPQPGEYLLHVYFNNDEVPNSPVMVMAKPQSEAESFRLESACARGSNGEMKFVIHGRQTDKLVVRCLDPVKEPTPHELKYIDDNKFSLVVMPDADGAYLLEVYYNGFLIQGCPRSFDVKLKSCIEYTSVVVPDLHNIELNVNQSVTFPIKMIGADQNDLKVTCIDPHGQEVDLEVLCESDNVLVTFRPLKTGEHSLNVSLNGSFVAGSPFKVHVSKPDGANLCTVKQEGIIDGVVKLKVIQKCVGTLQVSGTGPNNDEIPLKVTRISAEVACIDFTPAELGIHTIEILVDGSFIKGSPIEIDVQTLDADVGDIDIVENDLSECDSVASLQKAIVYLQLPDEMTLEYRVLCSDEDNNQVEVEKITSDHKSVTIRFTPVQKGQHVITLQSVTHENIKCSYTVFIQEITSKESTTYAVNSDFRATRSTSGSINQIDISSIEQINKPVFIGVTDPTVFTLKDWKRHSIPLIRILHVETRNVLPHTVAENDDSTFSISCRPIQPGLHKISVTCDAKPVPGTPLLFEALHLQGTKGVILEGPGVRSPLVVMDKTEFSINARHAGPGDIEVTICNAFGYLPVEIVDHDDYTYTARYQPITIGDYTVEVLFNGENVEQTPKKIEVLAAITANKSEPKIKRRVRKKDEPIFANAEEATEFVVIYETKDPIKFKILNTETSETVKYKAKRHRDGTFSLMCRPEQPGHHVIKLYENGELITKNPYKFMVTKGEGTIGVVVSGTGVQDGVEMNRECSFTIDTNRAGPGVLEVVVLQNSNPVPVAVSSKSDYVFTCKYVANCPKPLKISVMFDKKHVTGSPWAVNCTGVNKLVNDKGLERNDEISLKSAVSIPPCAKTAAYCKSGIRTKETSTTETEGSSSSLPTLSFSLPVRVSMEDGQKYIKLLIPINDLPALSNPKVYHINSSTKIPAAIVFSRHGYVLKCCPTLFGKYKVNVFDRSSDSVDPLVFFYFNFVESIAPSTSKLFALRSIHPTDFFPMDADSFQPNEIYLSARKVRAPIKVNTMCIFIVPKHMLIAPANVTIANKTTNQYIYSKTIIREDENPGILCYPTTPGEYRITIYPSASESVEIKFDFTVLTGNEFDKVTQQRDEEVVTQKPVSSNSRKSAVDQRNSSQIQDNPVAFSGPSFHETVVEVTNLRTGKSVPAVIKNKPSGEYTIQCEPTDPGKYIVQMTVNGKPVTGSPMYFTIEGDSAHSCGDRRAVYDISGQVRHCTQEIHFKPNGSGLGEVRFPCSLPGSEVNSVASDKVAVVKPCNNIFKSLAEQKAKFYGSDTVRELADLDDSLANSAPIPSPFGDDVPGNPVQIMLPYFPEKAKISVCNETSGTLVKSKATAHEQGTIMLKCDVTSEGRHRVDVMVDGKEASCGPLYFDVSSWDTSKFGYPGSKIDEIGSYEFNSFPAAAMAYDANKTAYDQFIVGFAFEETDQVPVSLSSFSEGDSSDEGERQEIRIQSSLELAALKVDVINEDTGEILRARLIERNGDYVVRCRPSNPGHYRVNVKDGESDVEGSPFYFDVLPQQAGSSAFVQHSPAIIDTTSDSDNKTGMRKEIYFLNPGSCDFERTLSSVGEAEIVFCATSLANPQTLLTIESTNEEVMTHAVDNEDGTYTLRFAPPRSGRYKLDIWDTNNILPGSPFYFDVNETESATTASNTFHVARKDQSFTVNKSEHTSFRIRTTLPIDVEITRENSSEKISYKLVTDNEYSTIICKPYHTGGYTVRVHNTLDHREVDMSPFYFTVPEPYIPADRLPRADSPVDGVRHEHLTIKSSSFTSTSSGVLFISDAQSHYLTRRGNSPKFVLPAVQQPEINVTDLETNADVLYAMKPYDEGSYIVEIPDNIPGRYQVTATIRGIDIPGTPFTFQIPDTNSSTTEIVSNASGAFELQNIDECIRRGDPIVLTIIAEEHPITRVTNLATRETIHVDVSKQAEMTYRITFCPFKSGRHEVIIKCKGVQVAGSPFFLDVDAVPISPATLNTVPSLHSISHTHRSLSHDQISVLEQFTGKSLQASSRKKSEQLIVEKKSSSYSKTSSSEFDDTSSTIFSEFSESTKNIKGTFSSSDSSSSSSGDGAVFITDNKTSNTIQTSKTTRTNINYEKLSLQKQLRNKIRQDATIIHQSGNFAQKSKLTEDHNLIKQSEDFSTPVDGIAVVRQEISTPEQSDEEENIDPHLFRSNQTLELGKTISFNIESNSYKIVVKNLTYSYQISHRLIEKRFGKSHIRFKPLFDGKYKIEYVADQGSVENFPLFFNVQAINETRIRTVDPNGQIPKLNVQDVIRIQVFARSLPKCKVYYLNRKLKVYSCTVDEGLDRYILSFIPCFPGKYKILARDNNGELAFSPLTLDVTADVSATSAKPTQSTILETRKVHVKSERGQETYISVGSEVSVSLGDSGYQSTFVSVKNLETKSDVTFSVNSVHEGKQVVFSPQLRGGYAISVVNETGHMSYSPIILYVTDSYSYTWQTQICQLKERYQGSSKSDSITVSEKIESVQNKETISKSFTEIQSHTHHGSSLGKISPFRCVSPVDCPYLQDLPPRSRSPSKVTFGVESKTEQNIEKSVIEANFIRFEQKSPKSEKSPSPRPSTKSPDKEIKQVPAILQPEKRKSPIDPYFAVIYPKSENELFKIFIHGLDLEKPMPMIVVTNVATLNQIQVYCSQENDTVVVRMKPIYNGMYNLDMYEGGHPHRCSPFIVSLDSELLVQYVVETKEVIEKETREQSIIFSPDIYPRVVDTRTSFIKSNYAESLWGDDLVECDIVNKRVDNVTISSKTLRFYKEDAFTSTTFDLDFQPKDDNYEKISPEPPEEVFSPLIMSVDLPSYPHVTVIDIHTKEELHVNIMKEEDSYIIKGQPEVSGHFKIDVLVDGDHILESPFYIEISKNQPKNIIFASMRPASPRPEDIIMMHKKMRRKPKKKKKKYDPTIPFLDGKPIDAVHLPAPGLFKEPIPYTPASQPTVTTTTTTTVKPPVVFTRTRRTVTTKRTTISESQREDYGNNTLVDFNEAQSALNKDMADLKLYLENYLEANIGNLSDTEDEREGYRHAEQRRFIFLDESSSFETDVFSRETKSMEFGFKCENAWCEELYIFLVHEETHEFTRSRLDKMDNDDEFACFARIHQDGRYVLEIFHKDRRLFKRRFFLLANDALGAAGLDMWGPGFVGPVVVDVKTWFFISFKRSGAGVLSCVYTDANEDPISLEANETENDVYKFEYIPALVGPIEIDVTFDEEDPPDLPKEIDCIKRPQLSNGATKFDLGMNNLEDVEVEVKDFRGLQIEPTIIKLQTNEISVTFSPEVYGKHTVSAKKNKKDIKGSPIDITIKDEATFEDDIVVYYAEDPFDASNHSNEVHPTVTGSVIARQQYVFARDPIPAEFLFTAKEAFVGVFRAYIRNLDTGEELSVDIEKEGELGYLVKLRCPRAGKHNLNLTVSNLTIPGCPLSFHCIDGLGAAGISASGQGFTGPHHESILNVLTVMTGLAGPGVLEVLLRDRNGDIPVTVKDTENGKILCSYTPGELPVFMEILFDKHHVPGSPRVVPPYEVFETSSDSSSDEGDDNASGKHKDVHYFYVNENATMDLDYAAIGDLQAEVVNFENENIKIKAKVTAIAPGSYIIAFKPKIRGLHMVEVFDGEFQLSNSPFFCTVLESRGKLAIEVYGPGIEGPLVLNRRTAFTVNTSGAGAGVMEVLVEIDDETVPVEVEDNFNDSITCYYTPTMWVDHTISVIYNKEHVKDSPKVLRVYVNDPKKKSMDDLDNGLIVKIPPGAHDHIFVEVEDPEGRLVDSSFTALGSDCIKICFETPVHGVYLCNVFFHNVHVKGSPIEILVGGVGGGQPLVPTGPGNFPKSLKPVNVGEPSQIVVVAKYKLRLDVDITHENTGTSLPITLKVENDGENKIIFTPLQLGGHVINIEVKGVPLPGCPLTVEAVKPPGAPAAKIDGLGSDGTGNKADDCAPFNDLDEFGEFGSNNINDPNARHALELYMPHAKESQKRKERILNLQKGTEKTFSIDTRSCGQGVLQVAIASNMGEVPISMHQNNDETYTASFTPESDGLLKISIKFNEKDVPGSPYIVVVGDSQPTVLDFNRFVVYCYDPNGALVTSALHEAPDGNIKLRFQPDDQGQYRVEIFNGDSHIQGSPFIVHVNKGDVEEKKDDFDILQGDAVLITKLHENIIYAWEQVTILLPAMPGEGGLVVTFLVTGKPDNSWRLIRLGDMSLISWCPPRGGRYRFEVTDKMGLQSTYFVDVVPVLDIPECVVTGPAFEKDVIMNETTFFTIDCSNSGNNTISLVLKNDEGKIPILLEELRHFYWKCTFHPTVNGQHLAVLHLDKTLYNEKFLCINVKKEIKGRCQLTDISPPIASVGVTIRFVLNLEGVSSDDIVVSIFDPNDELIECSAKTFDGVNVNIEFVAQIAGNHVVNVVASGEQIEGSPIAIDVQGEGHDITGSLTSILKKRINNTSISVGDGDTIVAKSSDEDKIKSAVNLATQFDVGQQASPPKRPIRALKSREVKVETPPFFLSPGSRNNSPFIANSSPILPKTVEETTVVETKSSSESAVLVGDEVNFVIRNVSSTDYNINIDGPAGFNSYCHSHYDDNNKTVNFRYVPEVSGRYSVRLYNKQSEIFESPIEFKVMPLPEPRIYLVVKGDGISKGVVNKPASFEVITNSSGNLTVSIEGPIDTKIRVADREGDTGCIVSYFPTVVGDYNIHLNYAGVAIDGSPYTANIGEPEEPITQISDKVFVDERFVIPLPRTTNTSDLVVSVGGPDGINTKVQISKDPQNKSVSYVPNLPGRFQLIVETSAGPIYGSPFNLTVIPRLSLECTCTGKVLEGMKVRELGTLAIEYNLENPGGLSYLMTGPSRPTLQISRRDNVDFVNFSPKKVGQYQLVVKYNNKVLKHSPFQFTVVDLSHFNFLYLQDALNSVQLNKNVAVTLDTARCGPGKVTAELQGPLHFDTVNVDNTPNTATIKFRAAKPGHYKLNMFYNGMSFPQSPFTFHVSRKSGGKATGMPMEGDGLKIAYVNKSNYIYISNVPKGTGLQVSWRNLVSLQKIVSLQDIDF